MAYTGGPRYSGTHSPLYYTPYPPATLLFVHRMRRIKLATKDSPSSAAFSQNKRWQHAKNMQNALGNSVGWGAGGAFIEGSPA